MPAACGRRATQFRIANVMPGRERIGSTRFSHTQMKWTPQCPTCGVHAVHAAGLMPSTSAAAIAATIVATAAVVATAGITAAIIITTVITAAVVVAARFW